MICISRRRELPPHPDRGRSHRRWSGWGGHRHPGRQGRHRRTDPPGESPSSPSQPGVPHPPPPTPASHHRPHNACVTLSSRKRRNEEIPLRENIIRVLPTTLRPAPPRSAPRGAGEHLVHRTPPPHDDEPFQLIPRGSTWYGEVPVQEGSLIWLVCHAESAPDSVISSSDGAASQLASTSWEMRDDVSNGGVQTTCHVRPPSEVRQSASGPQTGEQPIGPAPATPHQVVPDDGQTSINSLGV